MAADALHTVVFDMKFRVAQFAHLDGFGIDACKGLAAYILKSGTRLGNGVQAEHADGNAPAASGLNAKAPGHAVTGIKGGSGRVDHGVKALVASGAELDLGKAMGLH